MAGIAWWIALIISTIAWGISDGSEILSIDQLKKALEASADLPFASQRALLREIGDSFGPFGFHCNVFGGKDSCVEVSTNDTALGKLCEAPSKSVDCAFTYEAKGAVGRAPIEKLKEEGYGGCSECSNAVQKFWCKQTLPACGTFDGVVDELLPVVASVASKKASALGALKDSIPRVFQAASLGLPCRKMCEEITNTCGCGQSHTFGQVMTALQKKSSNSESFNVSISASTAKELFSGIWHTQVCQLFAEGDTPGFHGSCELNNPPKDLKCEWCKARARPTIFEEHIVIQLSQMFYGMMQGGLHHALMAASGGKGRLQENWSESLSSGGSVSGSRHTGVVILLLLLLALAIGAFVSAVRAHRHRQVPSLYIDLNSMGYSPPML